MNPLTVSALTTHIVALFDSDAQLRDVWVTGEVSNWRPAAGGHLYFSLKDRGSAISAVMWKSSAARQSWLPREGDQIIGHGRVGVYPDRGVYQIYLDHMQPAGRGALFAQFEALKERLAAEGLFASERKRPIPAYPRRIGVVTSAGAAALRDIFRVLSSRWPWVDVIVFPTLVQGVDAPPQIVDAIHAANGYHAQVEPIDTLLLARGGGSIEDLWAFNDEQVALAVAHSEIPVMTGIGHETDFTIVDFAADERASTPSVAAALATPDQAEVRQRLQASLLWLGKRMADRIAQARASVGQQEARLSRTHPQRRLDLARQRLDDRERRLHSVAANRLATIAGMARVQQSRLHALSPLQVLARGYSIVRTVDGQIVRDPQQVQTGERLAVRAAQGNYWVQVSDEPQALQE